MSICTELLAWRRMEWWRDWRNSHDLHVQNYCNCYDYGRLIVGIACQKSSPVHTAQDIMIVGEVGLCNWRQESRRTIVVAVLFGAEVSRKEWTSRWLEAWELSGWRCPRREERHQEQLSVYWRKSDLGNSRVFSEGGAASERCSDFLLGPVMYLQVLEFIACLGCSWWGETRVAILKKIKI